MDPNIEKLQELIAIQEITGKQSIREYTNILNSILLNLITNPNAEYEIASVLNNTMDMYTNNLQEFFSQSEDNRSCSRIINQMNTIINLILRYNLKKDDDAFVNFLFNCTDLYFSTNPTPEEIIASDSIDILWQLYNNNQLSNTHKQKFESIVEKIKKENEINFDVFNNAFKSCIENHQMFDEYLDFFQMYIVRLRNYYGILPEEYCDYFLREVVFNLPMMGQKLKDPDNIFSTILERALEDKERHVLKQNEFKNYIVAVCPLEEGKYARCNPNSKLMEFDVDVSEFSLMAIISLWHENQHAIQKDKKEDINPFIAYMISKEAIIKDENPEFYEENYEYMYEELDAVGASFQKTWEWIEIFYDQIGVDEAVRNKMKSYILAALKANDDKFNKAQNKKENGIETSVNEILTEIIQRKPNILKEHPELLIEFNEDGTLKDAVTMLKDYEALSEDDDLKNKEGIYDELFKFKISKFDLKDLNQVLQYEPQTIKGKVYRQSIIMNTVIPNLNDTYKEAYKVSSGKYLVLNQDKANQWENAIAILEESLKQNPEDDKNIEIANAISPMIDEFRNAIFLEVDHEPAKQPEDGTQGTLTAEQERNILKANFDDLTTADMQQGYSAIRKILHKAKEKAKEAVKKIFRNER